MRSVTDQRSRGRFNTDRPSHQQRQAPQSHQSLDSRGSDERIRGTASQIAARYLALARGTARNEDRVAAESYYQHAEHYIRVSNANREDDLQGILAPPSTPADVEINSADTGPRGDQVEVSQLR
jgi:hypothetical protein